MSQRKRDGRYPVPRTTRHVWVTPAHPGELPVQGYVIEFRRQSYRWTALVQMAAADEEGRAVSTQVWLPIERLIPVRSDPNDGGRVRNFG